MARPTPPQWRRTGRGSPLGASPPSEPDSGDRRGHGRPSPHEATRFAHNSERQFAKLLDFYGIAWEYEPRTFALEWDSENNPTQAFSPDFYLPAYDLFIEITTLNQRLVTKKNRKARRLQELYPDVRIKVFYQRDYLNLLVKYGLEPPSQQVPADEAIEPLPLRLAEAGDPPRRGQSGRQQPA